MARGDRLAKTLTKQLSKEWIVEYRTMSTPEIYTVEHHHRDGKVYRAMPQAVSEIGGRILTSYDCPSCGCYIFADWIQNQLKGG